MGRAGLTAVDVIRTKRDRGRLSDEQIDWVIDAYTRGAVADEQMSALAMAIFMNGMDVLGHRIAASTVWQILNDAGINPMDFVYVDSVFLKRVHALIVVEHGARRVYLAGITANPTGAWTVQAARNLLMDHRCYC